MKKGLRSHFSLQQQYTSLWRVGTQAARAPSGAIRWPHVAMMDDGCIRGASVPFVAEGSHVQIGTWRVESDHCSVVSLWHAKSVYPLIPAVMIGRRRCAEVFFVKPGVKSINSADCVAYNGLTALDFIGDAIVDIEGATIRHVVALCRSDSRLRRRRPGQSQGG